MAQTANTIFRDFVTDGVPSSGAHQPRKAEIREWGAYVEQLHAAAQAGGGVVFQTKAAMTLGYAANQIAWVIGDPTVANNGIYQKQGASGAGAWARVADLPYSFIRASNTGAGTADAIKATTATPVPVADGAALITVNVMADNTGPATIAFNDGPALAIVGIDGLALGAGDLVPDMRIAGYKAGSDFRLITDPSSVRNKEAAEAAQTAAETARDQAIDAASNAVSQGHVPIYATIAGMPAIEVPVGINAIRVNGQSFPGDGFGGLYIDSNNGATDQFMSQDGRTWYRVRDIALDRFPRDFTHGPKALKILWLADAQPVSSADIAYWRNVVSQIRTHHSDADYLFFIGDLVHRGEPATGDGPYYGFEDFIEDMRNIGIPRHRLFYIPGNHDRSYKTATESANGRSMRNYQNAGFEELFYSIRLGNMVFACMGAMTPQTPGDIPDYVVDWWVGINRQNKDKVLISVTHQPLWNPPYGSAGQMEAERFINRMTSGECPVDLWFGGHIGGNFTGTNVPPLTDGGGMWEQFGALHVQCGVHLGLGDSAEEQPFGDPCFVVMELVNGSDAVTLRRWNCNTQKYQESGPNKTVVKQVRHPVQLAWEPHYDGRHQFDTRNGIRTTPQKTFVNVEREEITPGVWGVPAKIQWVHETALEDRYADTMVAGNGVGHIFALPGASTNTESQMRAYGWAGGFSVERVGPQETGNYSGKTTLWSSREGRGKDSLLRVADFTATNWELRTYTSGGNIGWLRGSFDGIEIGNDTATAIPANNARIKVAEVTSGTAALVSRGNSANARKHIIFENNNGEVGSISTTNTATAYTTSSDEKWKDFIGELSGEDAIAIIKADPTWRFDWKPEYGGGSAVGWGAQTSFAVSPDLATPGGWIDPITGEPCNEGAVRWINPLTNEPCLESFAGWFSASTKEPCEESDEHAVYVEAERVDATYRPWGVDQSKRTPYLWAAVSYLVDQIAALQAELDALKASKSS